MRLRLFSILVSGTALLAVAGVARAAKPLPGYAYHTSNTSSPSVYFTAVSATKLTEFSAGLALHCKSTCSGFGGVRSFTIKSVKVSKAGRFTVSGNILAVNNRKLGTETVTGKFVTRTTVTGKVTTRADLGSYVGVTKSYTATCK